MSEHGPASDGEQRVVRFRRGTVGARAPAPPPVEDLAKYESAGEPDDYWHRMLVNTAALLFVAGLIGAGLWLAQSLVDLRREQDCVLAGHRNCAPLEMSR